MEEASPFKLVAGHVALDFVNTLDSRYQPERTVDLIPTYEEFLRFCTEAGVITASDASSLRQRAQRREAVLRSASELREALERIFDAILRALPSPAGDLAIVNSYLKEAAQNRSLTENVGRIGWQWEDLEENAVGPLWLIAEAAARLLTSEQVELVRQCGSETCRWLFLDASKNHSRRWCDMKLCGNRVKARKHYQRTRT
jgi:predicted RNA-binding Zn ribbon-like protein